MQCDSTPSACCSRVRPGRKPGLPAAGCLALSAWAWAVWAGSVANSPTLHSTLATHALHSSPTRAPCTTRPHRKWTLRLIDSL